MTKPAFDIEVNKLEIILKMMRHLNELGAKYLVKLTKNFSDDLLENWADEWSGKNSKYTDRQILELIIDEFEEIYNAK